MARERGGADVATVRPSDLTGRVIMSELNAGVTEGESNAIEIPRKLILLLDELIGVHCVPFARAFRPFVGA